MAARHAKTLKKLFSGIEISFASRNLERARRLSGVLGGVGAYGSYREAAESDGFDISFITTPHAVHSELAVLSADQGKDVILEKPVTRTLAELAAVQEAVSQAGVRCTVAENYHFKPAVRAIRRDIDEGLIGDVLVLELTKTNLEEKTGWRTDEVLMGGGALLEGGVHWVNALTTLSGGVPTEVTAARPAVDYASGIPIEDTLLLVARFSNGAVGRLLHSWRIQNRFFGMGLSKIYGTEGVITLESNGLYYSVFGRRKKKRIMNPFDFLGFRSMLRTFVRNWTDGTPWEPTLERIGFDMRVVDAAYRSLETNRFEAV
jgi:predicted dehydrogenase